MTAKNITVVGFALLICVAGCVTSTSNVTGRLRSPVEPRAVNVYYTMPAHSEVIGTISAVSYYGFTAGQADACALRILRSEAGKLGANGVVIYDIDDKPLKGAKAKGNAIFITP